MPTEPIKIVLEEVAVGGASPSTAASPSAPELPSAAEVAAAGPTPPAPATPAGKPEHDEQPAASKAMEDVVSALKSISDNLEDLLKKRKEKDVVEVTQPGEDPKLLNQYSGNFGDRNRRFPSESEEAFGQRQNLLSKIAIGGDLARNVQSLAMGPRRDPSNDIGQAGETAAKALSLVGPQAAIVGEAFKQLTGSVAAAMRNLEARSEQLKAYSPELAMADARRQVSRMQSDIMLAQRMGTELARYTDASAKLEVTASEIKAKFDMLIAKILTPLLEAVNKVLGWLFGEGGPAAGKDKDKGGAKDIGFRKPQAMDAFDFDKLPPIAGAVAAVNFMDNIQPKLHGNRQAGRNDPAGDLRRAIDDVNKEMADRDKLWR